MQVKKFEAKTMQEALQMVKTELGPEAIILSAKEHKKSYGLAGEKSVELTAAISEQKYKERQFALQKLKKEEDRQKFLAAKAKTQKQYINKTVESFYERQRINERHKLPVRKSYIDIDDEEIVSTQASVSASNTVRVQNAAKQALASMHQDFNESQRIAKKSNNEVAALKSEIQRLNAMLANFKNVPQNFIAEQNQEVPTYLLAMYEKLIAAGIAKDIVVAIMVKAKAELSSVNGLRPAVIEGWVAKYILETIEVTGEASSKKIEAFLGASGSGKTASLIKYASHQIIMHRKSVAIITTDNIKVGATEQLKIFARILNVPFAIINKPSEWPSILSQLKHIDHILVDTPGYTLKNLQEIDSLKERLEPLKDNVKLHYVCPITVSESQAIELAKRYQMFHFDDIICTKLDETNRHGLLYTLNKKLNIPLHSFGIGANVPEDFEFATRERVLDLIFKITKNKG